MRIRRRSRNRVARQRRPSLRSIGTGGAEPASAVVAVRPSAIVVILEVACERAGRADDRARRDDSSMAYSSGPIQRRRPSEARGAVHSAIRSGITGRLRIRERSRSAPQASINGRGSRTPDDVVGRPSATGIGCAASRSRAIHTRPQPIDPVISVRGVHLCTGRSATRARYRNDGAFAFFSTPEVMSRHHQVSSSRYVISSSA